MKQSYIQDRGWITIERTDSSDCWDKFPWSKYSCCTNDGQEYRLTRYTEFGTTNQWDVEKRCGKWWPLLMEVRDMKAAIKVIWEDYVKRRRGSDDNR